MLRLLFGIAALFLSACSSPPPSVPPADDIFLIRGRWLLTTIEGRQIPSAVASQSNPPSLTFTKYGSVRGFAGVNSLTCPYTSSPADKASISFGALTTTMMAGPEQAMEVEKRFLSALIRVDRFHFDGPALVLSDKTSELLRLYPSVYE